MRLFFLEKDGWFEVEMTEKLLSSPKEELLRWIYATMDRHYYRNYLITENPEYNAGIKIKLLIDNYL